MEFLNIEQIKEDPCFIYENAPAGEFNKYYEGLMAQGSGYFHMRACFEEGLCAAPQNEDYMRLPANVTLEKPRHPLSKNGLYVPGITGRHPLLNEEIINLPNLAALNISIDGRPLDMADAAMNSYLRYLNLQTGELCRSFLWQSKNGLLRFSFKRVLPRHLGNILMQQIEVEAVDSTAQINIENNIDCDVRTNGYKHFKICEKTEEDGHINVLVKTDNGDEVKMRSGLFENESREAIISLERKINKGEKLCLKKIGVIATSRDIVACGYLADRLEKVRQNFAAALEKNTQEMQKLWQESALTIKGDNAAQKAVNFSIYHLLRCASPNDSRVAICAKGYSGEAYFGHYFWDTEMYMLPFFLCNQPDLAENLVRFRLQSLGGAKRNAQKYGYPGARYAWESSVEGDEQCPNWQYCDHEVHINADVVFGIWHAAKAAGSNELLKEALPLLLETALYWQARVYREKDGGVSINGVMGPDEYICICNNNRYTNYMVAKSLEITLEAVRLFPVEFAELKSKMKLGAEFENNLKNIMQALYAYVPKQGLIEQCDGFEKYEEPEFDKYWPERSKPYGACVSQERNYRTKALKQADVLMLPFLFATEFSTQQLSENFDYYLPYTTHDSSLSVIVHSILCCRLNRTQQAQQLFEQALKIDLDPQQNGAAEGVHIANCGGIWQAVVYGFCGLSHCYESEEPSFAPNLPENWQEVSFNLNWKGKIYKVKIEQNKVTLEAVE